MSAATEAPSTTASAATRAYYTLTVTRWFPVGFVVGIFVLYATERGLTTAQALTAFSVAGIVCFLLELPTSGLADAHSRRAVYLGAAVVNVLTGALYLIADSFAMFALAAAAMGAFRALDSGPLEAWFVDAVHVDRPGADVDQQLSRGAVLLGVAMALGSLLSGGLIWWHPITAIPAIDAAVWVFAALNVVHLVCVLVFMRGDARPADTEGQDDAGEGSPGLRQVIGSGLRLMTRSPVLAGLILAEVCWSVAMISFESLMPLRLAELLGSATEAAAWMGPAAAASWGLFSLGAALAGLLSKRIGVTRAAMTGRVLNSLGAISMGLVAGPAALIAAYLLTYTAHGVNGPPHSALLHRVATSRNRSTVLSLNSMMAFLAFAVATPLLGVLADASSLVIAIIVAGAVGLAGTLAYLPARRAERERDAALAETPTAPPD